MTNILHTNYRDDWETPRWFFDWLRKRYDFQHDLAATPENALCRSYYTPEDDALKSCWLGCHNLGGWGWLNPPYGAGLGKWVERAAHYATASGEFRAVLLLPANTSTKWFCNHVLPYARITWLEGRLNFLNGGKPTKNGNTGSNFLAQYPSWPAILPAALSLQAIKKEMR